MKVEIELSVLKEFMSNVKYFVRENKMFLQSRLIQLEVKDNNMIARYRTLEQSIEVNFGLNKVESGGTVTILAGTFIDNILGLSSSIKVIELYEKNNKLVIQCGKSFSKISILLNDDFEASSAIQTREILEIDAMKFNELIYNVGFAASSTSENIIMQAISLKISSVNNEITMAATDANKLAISYMDINSKEDFEILVPAMSLMRLSRILTGTIQLGISDQYLVLKMNNYIINNRLLPGSFPNYEKIIGNKDLFSCIKVNIKQLKPILGILLSYNTYVYWEYDSSSKELVLTTKETILGFTKQYINIVDANIVSEIGFSKFLINIQLIKDYLDTLNEGDIEFKYYGEHKHLISSFTNRETVFMPIRDI